jgi:hypothetical protein
MPGERTGSILLSWYSTDPLVLPQTKHSAPLLSVLLAREIFASIVLYTNAAAAHEETKVQPETRIRSSMRSMPCWFFWAQLNQLTTLSRM